MPLTTVEKPLAIVRMHLVECSARDDGDKDSTEELAQIIACLRRDAAEAWRSWKPRAGPYKTTDARPLNLIHI